MANNVTIKDGANADAVIATRDKGPSLGEVQYVQIDLGGAGAITPAEGTLPVSAAALPLPAGAATEVTLAAVAASLAGTLPVSGPLTDTQLRAAAVPVSGPLTNTQLRASAVLVSAASLPLPTGAATEATLAAAAASLAGTLAVSGPLTDAQLRATAVPVSGPLTDAQLRAAAVPVSEPVLTLTGQAAQTAAINNILEAAAGAGWTDVSGFRSASVQLVSTGTGGTFIFEQSNDGINAVALPVFNAALVTGVAITAAITATASTLIYTFPIRARFARLRIATPITGGSIQAFSRFSPDAWTPAIFNVAQPTAANLNVTASGTVTANIGTGSLAAGTNAIGDVGTQYRGTATGAGTPTAINSPATPVGQTIKGAAGRLLGMRLTNTGAAARFVKFFNATAVTPGTTAAAFELALPVNASVDINVEGGIAFGTGIMIMVTGARGLTNNTAITLDDVTGFTIHA